VVECQKERSQLLNRRLALDILKSRLYEKELSSQQTSAVQQRKLQIGGANRYVKAELAGTVGLTGIIIV